MERVDKFVVHHHSGIRELKQWLQDAAAAAAVAAAATVPTKNSEKKKTSMNKQLEPKTQSFLAACRGLS